MRFRKHLSAWARGLLNSPGSDRGAVPLQVALSGTPSTQRPPGKYLTPEVDDIHAEMVNQLLCPAHAVMSAIHQAYDSTNPVDAAEALSEACEELTEYRLHLRWVHDLVDKNRLAIIETWQIKETQQ